MRIAVISDTHMPRGRRRLPERAVELIRAADLIIHAGDFIAVPALRMLEGMGEIVAVHGNVDEPALQRRLPRTVTVEAAGARIGVVHDAGPGSGRLQRLRRELPDADAVVFGHSHMPLHEISGGGAFQIFNPGSPTERRRSPHHTMGVAAVRDGAISFELIVLD